MRYVGRFKILTAFVLLLASVAHASDDATEFDKQYTLGKEAFEREDFRTALSAFDAAIKLKPTLDALAGRAAAKGELGDLQGAIDDITTAMKTNLSEHDAALAYEVRGCFYGKKKDLNHAISDCTVALETDPKCWQALMVRSGAWLVAGNYDLALADLDTLISARPEVPEYYLLRNACRYANKDWKGAIADADKAISLDPKEIKGYVARGFAHIGNAEYAEALDDFNRAIQIDEEHSGLAVLGKCVLLTTCPQQKFRDPAEAIRLAQKSSEQTASHDSRRVSCLATVYAQTGDFENAIMCQRKAVATASPDRLEVETCRLEQFKKKLPLFAPDGSDINRAFGDWR